jgi:hypothetical protein
MLGNSWVAAQLVVSQEQLSSMELVSYYGMYSSTMPNIMQQCIMKENVVCKNLQAKIWNTLIMQPTSIIKW